MSEGQAFTALANFLEPRIEQARRGELSGKSLDEILHEAPMDSFRPLLAIGTLSAVLALGFFWGGPTHCVQLPNGLNIGKQALIDQSRPCFRPDIVPKFDNGKSLPPGDAVRSTPQ